MLKSAQQAGKLPLSNNIAERHKKDLILSVKL